MATSLGIFWQVPQLAYAQGIDISSPEQQSGLHQGVTSHSSEPHGAIVAAPMAEPDELNGSDALDHWLSPSARLVSIFPHSQNGRQAATVYIRSIPVVTVIGAAQSVAEGPKSVARDNARLTDPDLIARVIAIATQLETFSQAGTNASHIGVRWDADQEDFVIALAGRDLSTINETTIFPNTFRDPAVDALQVANRLRYLLGDAPPLATIEGLPEPAPEPAPVETVPRIAMVLTGVASWYGPGFHGRRSASGEVFNQNAMTAAHRHLPFGTRVRVTNLNNGRQVIVRINDRGPFIQGRTIDVSAVAAATLGMTHSGIARVKLEVFDD